MEPSAEFLKKLAGKPQLLKLVDRFKKEFEIYQYLSDHIPKKFTDTEWEKLMNTKSVDERVAFWTFTSITQRKEQLDTEKQEAARKKIVDMYIEEEAKYKSGAMGYGPGLYRMFLDPFAQMKQKIEYIFDIKQYITTKLRDHPTIAFDFQYLKDAPAIHKSRLAENVRFAISDNRLSLRSYFPLELINVNLNEPTTKTFIDKLGFYQRETRPSIFLPEIHKTNPYLDAKGMPKKNIVYISRYARDMLDGPLTHDAYILPVSFDLKRESIGGIRNANIKALTLPIRKYIKWKSGPMYLPLSNIQKVFDVVSRTGGDWHRALHENVAKRHLTSHEESREKNPTHRDIAKFRLEERKRVIETIKEALGEA